MNKTAIRLSACAALVLAGGFYSLNAEATWTSLGFTASAITKDRRTGDTYAVGTDWKTLYKYSSGAIGGFVLTGGSLGADCYGGGSSTDLCAFAASGGDVLYTRSDATYCTGGYAKALFHRAVTDNTGSTEYSYGSKCWLSVAVDGLAIFNIYAADDSNKTYSSSYHNPTWTRIPGLITTAVYMSYDSVAAEPFFINTVNHIYEYNGISTWNMITGNACTISQSSSTVGSCPSPLGLYELVSGSYSYLSGDDTSTSMQQFTTNESGNTPEFYLTNTGTGTGTVYYWH